MPTLAYSLIDVPDAEKDFDSVQEAVNWMKHIGQDMFTSVSLTDGKENYVEGFDAIIKAYNNNNDLWNGDADCIHLNTHSGIGGGCHCNTCPGWFCY